MPNINPVHVEGRNACPLWDINMAVYLEQVVGYDPSQFDFEYISQMDLRTYVCNWLQNLETDGGVDEWVVTQDGQVVLSVPITTPIWPSWRFAMIGFIETLLAFQNPYPVVPFGPITLGGIGDANGITDINSDGYIDQYDLDHFMCFSCN